MERNVLAFDNGTGFMKVGFAGERRPKCVFPTMLGTPVVGRRVVGLKSMLQLSRPVKRGIIENWDVMKTLWDFAFKLLKVTPSECKVLLTEPLFAHDKMREKIADVMFKEFNVRALQIDIQPLLALYAYGKSTGMIVDIGHGLTQLVPIYRGFIIPKAAKIVPLGGQDITAYLIRLLMHKGYYLTTIMGMEIAKEIKERLCYVALDPKEEAERIRRRKAWPEDLYTGIAEEGVEIKRAKGTYRLIDGTVIRLEEEVFLAPEVLFNPSLIGADIKSLPSLIIDSIMACDIDLRKELLRHIILCGGTSMLKGLPKRLMKELVNGLRERGIKTTPRVVTPKLREIFVWIGASKLASLIEEKDLWVYRDEYEKHGIRIFREKLAPAQAKLEGRSG